MTPGFAFCNKSSYDHMAFLFAVESWRLQLLDFCRDWGLPPKMAAPYSDVSQLPGDAAWTGFILDKLDDPDAAAYHTVVSNRPLLMMLASYMPSDGSHEVLETSGDEDCDRWVPMGDGREMAAEVSDPVQGDTYPLTVTVAGETRHVLVSDYVLPPYFDRAQSGPTRKMEALGLMPHLEPFAIAPGGYAVILGRDGNENQVFGARPVHIEHDHHPVALAAIARKINRPDSRLLRRLRGKR